MKVSASTPNANFKITQSPAFKGRVEQKIFMKVVEEQLLDAFKDSTATNIDPIKKHFTAVMDKLRALLSGAGYKVDAKYDAKDGSSLSRLSFKKATQGAEDERISIYLSRILEGVELRYTEQQLLEGNPGWTNGVTNTYRDIIYTGLTKCTAAQTGVDNVALRRYNGFGIQDYEFLATGKVEPNSNVFAGYTEFLNAETGRFGNRTKLKVAQD